MLPLTFLYNLALMLILFLGQSSCARVAFYLQR